MILITGTNGKTFVAVYVQQILENLGCAACSIGTLGVLSNSVDIPNHHNTALTTPNWLLSWMPEPP